MMPSNSNSQFESNYSGTFIDLLALQTLDKYPLNYLFQMIFEVFFSKSLYLSIIKTILFIVLQIYDQFPIMYSTGSFEEKTSLFKFVYQTHRQQNTKSVQFIINQLPIDILLQSMIKSPNITYSSQLETKNLQPKFCSQQVEWQAMLLKGQLLRAIKDRNFHNPSEVQFRGIPAILKGKNLICQAKSGMGKTLVFIIGILNLIMPEQNGQYLPHQCIVIVNTRQLAYQISNQFTKLGTYFNHPKLRYGCFFGGLPIHNDMEILKNKNTSPHIIIGTVGRLLDLMQRGYISLATCKYFVLDQCDALLSAKNGSIIQISKMAQFLSKDVQMIMLSATIDQQIKVTCKSLMKSNNIQTICVDQGKLTLKGLNQYYILIQESRKFQLLTNALDNIPFQQVIIFVNKVSRVHQLQALLKSILFTSICIHSSLSQVQRLANYQEFKNNNSRVLVATNLFGRGIDIHTVNLIINYDFPQDQVTYLHRVGRAGRFGNKGIVLNFIKPSQPNDRGISQLDNMKLFEEGLNSKIVEMKGSVSY